MCKLCGTSNTPYTVATVRMPVNNKEINITVGPKALYYLKIVNDYIGENCCRKCLRNITTYFSNCNESSQNWKGEKSIDNYILTRLERTYLNPNFSVTERTAAKNRIFTKEHGFHPYGKIALQNKKDNT